MAGILGLSPWASPYSVWLSKVSDDVEDDGPSEAMEFGTRAEPMLGKWFTDRTGLFVAGEQTWCTHTTERWARCTVDGFVFDHDGPGFIGDAIAVAEWKTTSDAASVWADAVPAHYATQATWTMFVTGLDVVHFGVLHLAYGRPAFRVYEFARDPDDEAFVVSRCAAFWRDHVLTGDPPPIDAHEATTQALRGQWGGTGGIVEADMTAQLVIAEFCYHRAQVKAAEHDQQQAANRLEALLGNDTELHSGGRKLVTWKPQERTTVDTAAMRRAWPDLVRDFERTSTSRVLRVNEPKEK